MPNVICFTNQARKPLARHKVGTRLHVAPDWAINKTLTRCGSGAFYITLSGEKQA
jgi:hypothetical protein